MFAQQKTKTELRTPNSERATSRKKRKRKQKEKEKKATLGWLVLEECKKKRGMKFVKVVIIENSVIFKI